MIPMPDSYTVRLVDMPVNQGGMISEDPDGHINVYINARLSDAGRHTAAAHEWEHWYNDDLHNDRDIREVEGGTRKARRLKMLMRARDLMPKPAPKPRPPLITDMDKWKNDIIHRLQDYRDMS